jgi:hypothetical protein
VVSAGAAWANIKVSAVAANGASAMTALRLIAAIIFPISVTPSSESSDSGLQKTQTLRLGT